MPGTLEKDQRLHFFVGQARKKKKKKAKLVLSPTHLRSEIATVGSHSTPITGFFTAHV